MSYVEPEGLRFDLARQQALQVLDGLTEYLRRHAMTSVHELVGKLGVPDRRGECSSQ